MSDHWYRNTTWDHSIEQAFEAKLRQARDKEQYLRIQACTLVRSHPDVALELLNRYFALPNDFDHAQAHVDRATALVSLGRIEEAMASYEAALAREALFPKLQTQAYLELPYLIATRKIRNRFARALELLQTHQGRLIFPVDQFRWYAARALIAADTREGEVAEAHAVRALETAAEEHSGFRYHPSVGLVTEQYDEVIEQLKGCRAA
jgi:tetratricopeptide (TPR) repeat protein